MRIAVIGAGIVGLSTAAHLLESGEDEVHCFEAAGVMGERSKGDTRIFRLFHRDPGLAVLSLEARREWSAWERRAGHPLVGTEGLFVSSPDVEELQHQLRSVGIETAVVPSTQAFGALSATGVDGPLLHDVNAGVIDVRATARFLAEMTKDAMVLEAVQHIELLNSGAMVVTRNHSYVYDSVVAAAGAHTPTLASSAGIGVPADLQLHVRFTFPMTDRMGVAPCWLDNFEGFPTYGHMVRPGQWAIGGHFPTEQTQAGVGIERVAETSLTRLQRHIARRLDRVRPEPIDEVRCDFDSGGVDGIYAKRNGAVLAIWGDNLFKFAPILSKRLAIAAHNFTEPDFPG